jgi:hypothetical protein
MQPVKEMLNHSTERLADLIRSKHQVLVQLRDVGLRQSGFVASGDNTSLLTLLAAKQHLISVLQGLERELAPYMSEDPRARIWRTPEDRARCARQAAECNLLLEEIVQLEKAGADQMTARRNEMADQLERFHAATHVRSAYEAQRRNSA